MLSKYSLLTNKVNDLDNNTNIIIICTVVDDGSLPISVCVSCAVTVLNQRKLESQSCRQPVNRPSSANQVIQVSTS